MIEHRADLETGPEPFASGVLDLRRASLLVVDEIGASRSDALRCPRSEGRLALMYGGRDTVIRSEAAGAFSEIVRALLESEETYHLVFARERDAMSLIDGETKRFLDVNDAWCALYGYTRDETRSMIARDVMASAEEVRAASGRVLEQPSAGSGRHELRWHRKKDGSVFPLELVCGTLRLSVGQAAERRATYVVARDISERIGAEDALRRSEAGFRSLIERLPDAVLVHRRGIVSYANPAAVALMSFDGATDLRGTVALDFVHPDDRERVRERSRWSAQRASAPFREERLVRRDGSVIHVELATIRIEHEGAPASLEIARDVTERKLAEARSLTRDRLASLGRLAASVGHEINNPLAWMMGNLQLVERDLQMLEGTLDEDTRVRMQQRVRAISEGAERVRNIVRDLKTLSRDDNEPPRAVDLHRALDLCADMAMHELRHRAQLVKEYCAPTPLLVRGSEGRLGQVFLNLIVNAAQAIPEGAVHANEVRVRTSIRAADASGTALAIIEVEDTGCGLASEARERLFEPFFTTKGPGEGTGLGLSISHHIVTAMKGRIEVEARAMGGTRFRVLLPLSSESELPQPAAHPVSGAPAAARTARILVVDDQPDIADVVSSCLSEHEVTIVHSGREAIALLDRDDDPRCRFDVVLCDVMMGDLTGIDVYDHLARDERGIEQRLVWITGGAHTERARELLARVPNPRIEKPFCIDELRRTVQSVLARRDA